MLTVYIGSTFKLAGALQIDGAPADFSGWTLSANLYDQAGVTLISALTVSWVDQTQGILTMTAPTTSGWPPGKARIDCKATTPLGDVVIGPPTYLRIEQSPMS